jgi:hypothetical protein
MILLVWPIAKLLKSSEPHCRYLIRQLEHEKHLLAVELEGTQACSMDLMS